MGKDLDRRTFMARSLAIAAGMAAGGALDGALPGLAGAATNGSGRNGITTAKPQKGGSLVVGNDAEDQGFDPTSARYDESGYMYARAVFDPLVTSTHNGGWVPYLAQSFLPNDDYTVWTITMRPDVFFSDGTPCDANALHINLEKQFASALTGPVFSSMNTEAKITGPMTVEVTVKSPWITFPYYFTSQVGYVAAPSMLASPNGTENPVGTGPFIKQSWVPNVHFIATKNPHYWRKGYPYLDQITFKPIIDDQARADALQSGTIDIMQTNYPPSILQFRGNKSYSYVDDSGTAVVGQPDLGFIMLNTAVPPFNDPNARLALAKAVNRSAAASILSENVDAPVSGLFVPGTPWYSKTSYPAYDPSGAKKLVKQYEQKHGKKLSFTIGTIPDPYTSRIVSYFQQQYRLVGAQVSQNVVQQSVLIDNALVGKFQAVTWRQFGSVDPDLNYVWMSTTTLGKVGSFSLNFARNDDPRIQTALTKGRSTNVMSQRVAAYRSVNEYLAQDLPYLWIARTVWALAANPKVQNFNNPKAPNGTKQIGMEGGVMWPTQIWMKS